MTPTIDLTRHHFLRELGDMCLFGSWIFNEDKEDTEPCLILMPRYRNPASVKPCVIVLSAAWKYRDMKYLVRAAKYMAKCLGFEDEMARTHKIADAIYNHLDDLVMMPPDPTRSIVVGEASLDLGNGKRTTVEVIDYEQKPQM